MGIASAKGQGHVVNRNQFQSAPNLLAEMGLHYSTACYSIDRIWKRRRVSNDLDLAVTLNT